MASTTTPTTAWAPSPPSSTATQRARPASPSTLGHRRRQDSEEEDARLSRLTVGTAPHEAAHLFLGADEGYIENEGNKPGVGINNVMGTAWITNNGDLELPAANFEDFDSA